MLPVEVNCGNCTKALSSFIPMFPGYILWSEGYIPSFLQGTIVLGTVVTYLRFLQVNILYLLEYRTTQCFQFD